VCFEVQVELLLNDQTGFVWPVTQHFVLTFSGMEVGRANDHDYYVMLESGSLRFSSQSHGLSREVERALFPSFISWTWFSFQIALLSKNWSFLCYSSFASAEFWIPIAAMPRNERHSFLARNNLELFLHEEASSVIRKEANISVLASLDQPCWSSCISEM